MITRALIIAIEEYPKASGLTRTLPGTNQAAADFRHWLTNTKKVVAGNILACADETCSWRTTGTSRQEIVAAISELVSKGRNHTDELYFFYSGHGFGFTSEAYTSAIEVLVGNDFVEPAGSGGACFRLQEVKEKLRIAMGPGDHFYFIDACRNKLKPEDIQPGVLGQVFGTSNRENASTYVLFSTPPGDVAVVGADFSAALLEGLLGGGRAKVWVKDKMYVTFDSLCSYVRETLNRPDLDPEKKGPGTGKILQLVPTPTYNCEVEVLEALRTDQFTLEIRDVRDGFHPTVSFQGDHEIVPLKPDDYYFTLKEKGGQRIPQVEPPADDPLDLYDACLVRFKIQPPGTPPPPPQSFPATLNLTGTPGTDLLIRNLQTGTVEKTTFGTENLQKAVGAGEFEVEMREGALKLRSARVQIRPGKTHNLDLIPRPATELQAKIHDVIEKTGPGRVAFSESLGPVSDWDLSLWLAIIGGSRIVAEPDTFQKLRSIKLDSFEETVPGSSALYVLAAFDKLVQKPQISLGRKGGWKLMRAVDGLPGLFEFKAQYAPGSNLVTLAPGKQQSITLAVHGFPNRATFLTFTNDEKKRLRTHHYVLPIHSVQQYLSVREREYFSHTPPLRLIRYMATVQRQFAKQAPVEAQEFQPGGLGYWNDLLYQKWLDPMMAVIACYELVRRGKAEKQAVLMKDVVGTLRQYFPGLPDTEAIAKLLGQGWTVPDSPPLLLDGVLALGEEEGLTMPLPAGKLNYAIPWTSWANAIVMAQVPRPVQALASV